MKNNDVLIYAVSSRERSEFFFLLEEAVNELNRMIKENDSCRYSLEIIDNLFDLFYFLDCHEGEYDDNDIKKLLDQLHHEIYENGKKFTYRATEEED